TWLVCRGFMPRFAELACWVDCPRRNLGLCLNLGHPTNFDVRESPMSNLTLQVKSEWGRWLVAGLVAGLLVSWMLFDAERATAQNPNQKNAPNQNQKKPNKNPPQKPVANKPVAAPPPKSALLTTEDWQKAPLKALEPSEIDRLIAKELQQDKVAPAALTTDE